MDKKNRRQLSKSLAVGADLTDDELQALRRELAERIDGLSEEDKEKLFHTYRTKVKMGLTFLDEIIRTRHGQASFRVDSWYLNSNSPQVLKKILTLATRPVAFKYVRRGTYRICWVTGATGGDIKASTGLQTAIRLAEPQFPPESTLASSMGNRIPLSTSQLCPDSFVADGSGEFVASYPLTLLETKTSTPQWTDYRELDLRGGQMRAVSCKIKTASQYFRFGFKLRTRTGRLFGDASVQSCADTNLVIHIGRDKVRSEIFFTSYWNGIREKPNLVLHPVSEVVSSSFEFSVDGLGMLSLKIDGAEIGPLSISPGICESVVMLAWGDHDEYEVEVRDLVVRISLPQPHLVS